MIVVILSTGKSTRFTSNGFKRQKSMLPMYDGSLMLEWQLRTLTDILQEGDTVLYVSREEYREDEEADVETCFHNTLGYYFPADLISYSSYWLEGETSGALDAMWEMQAILMGYTHYQDMDDQELLLMYNDEVIDPAALRGNIIWAREVGVGIGAMVAAFQYGNPRYTRIPGYPDFACGCTYWFRSLLQFYDFVKDNPKEEINGAPDIVYRHKYWKVMMIPPRKYIEVGTAQEYADYMKTYDIEVDWYDR